MSKIIPKVKPVLSPADTDGQTEEKREAKKAKPRAPFALLPGFFGWIVLVFFARIFTQALSSPISSILYVFILILPLLSVAYLAVLWFTVTAVSETGVHTASKNEPVPFTVCLKNAGILPVPTVEAEVLLPDAHAVRCTRGFSILSLVPFGTGTVSQDAVFPFRGRYEIGIEAIWLYDPFRFARIKKNTRCFSSVAVLPGNTEEKLPEGVILSDDETESNQLDNGADRAELSDIRQYVAGDHMKNIHWKLSTKSEELMVKKYSMNNGRLNAIYADLAAMEEDRKVMWREDVNEYLADAVVEETLALAKAILRRGGMCSVDYVDDRRRDEEKNVPMNAESDLERLRYPLATVPIARYDQTVGTLIPADGQITGTSLFFVTGNLSAGFLRDVGRISQSVSGSEGGRVHVIYLDPTVIRSPEFREKTEAEYRAAAEHLASAGVSLDVRTLPLKAETFEEE